MRKEQNNGEEKYKKFYEDLISSLKINSIPVPKSIVDNADGDLYQGSIGGKHEYQSYCMTTDSKFLVRGTKNRSVKLISINNQRIMDRVENMSDSVVATFITEDKSVLITSTFDRLVTAWSLAGLKKIENLQQPSEHLLVTCLSGTSNLQYVIGMCPEGLLIFWRLGNYRIGLEVKLPQVRLLTIKCSPDAGLLACACSDKTVRFWCLEKLKPLFTISDLTENITSIAFSSDSRSFIGGSTDKTIKIWSGERFKDTEMILKHFGSVECVAISPDEKYLAAASNKLLLIFNLDASEESADEGTKEIFVEDKICNLFFAVDALTLICCCSNDKILTFEIETGEIIFQIKGESHHTPILITLVSPDSKTVISGTANGEIKVWSIDTYQFIATLIDPEPETNDVSTLCISPNSKYIACAPYKEYRIIKIWATSTKQMVKVIEIIEGVDDICFSYDSEFLICSSSETDFWLWDLEKLEKQKVSKKISSKILCMVPSRMSPEKKYLVASTQDRNIIIWDYPHFEIVATMQEEDIPSLYHIVIISYNCKYLATASDKNRINLWSLKNFRMLKSLEGHTDRILSISFSPDANYILSCSRNDKVIIWSTFFGDTKLFVLEGETRTINCVCVSPDSRFIFGGSDDASINVWRLDSNLPKSHLKTSEEVDFYAISPDSQFLAIVMQSTVELWNLETLTKLDNLEDMYLESVTSLTFAPNSLYMLIGSSEDSCVIVINMKTLNILASMDGQPHGCTEVYSIAVAAKSKWVVIADKNQNLYKWNTKDYTFREAIKIKNDQITAIKNTVCITSDSRYIVAAYGRGFIAFWHFKTMSDERKLQVHDSPINQIAVMSDSKYVISSSVNDKVIKILSLTTFQVVDTIEHTHHHPISHLSLSSDNKYMVGTLEDKTCRIWSLQSFQEIDLIQDYDTGQACCISPNAKYLVLKCFKQRKTVIYPFLSDHFQTYPFILNLIKAYFQASSKEVRTEILNSLIVIVTKHRKYYQLVLNPIFSIITLLLNEELTTGIILSQYLTPYKLFPTYEPLTVVIMNNRIESAKTYLSIMESYKRDHGFYPYFDQNFIRLLLTKHSNLINSIEMKQFIIENLFYFIETKKGELQESGGDIIDVEDFGLISFGPKDLKNQMNFLDSRCEKLMKSNPVNVSTYDCYISLIPLDFRNGSEFSRMFFQNHKIFPQVEIETKLRIMIYHKWNKVYPYCLAQSLVFWLFNLAMYYYLGFDTSNKLMAAIVLTLNSVFMLCEIKLISSMKYEYLKNAGRLAVLLLNILSYTTIAAAYLNAQTASMAWVHWLRLVSILAICFRGIWLMRVFQPCRFLVCMVYQVFIKIREFFILFFYLIFIMEAVWRILPTVTSGNFSEQYSFSDSLKNSFAIAFMSYDTTEYQLKEWIVFVVGILVLNFIMLNYLVSIICICYEDVAANKLITDLDEVLKMIQEVDHLFSGVGKITCKKHSKVGPVDEEESEALPAESPGVHYISLVPRQADSTSLSQPGWHHSQKTGGTGTDNRELHSDQDMFLERVASITENKIGQRTQEIILYIDAQNKKIRQDIDAKLTIFMQQMSERMESFLEEIKNKSEREKNALNTSYTN